MPDGLAWKELLSTGLSEDGWAFDWTTLGTLSSQKTVRGRIIAKAEGVWAADGLVAATNQLAGMQLVTPRVENGARFKPGDVLVEWSGPTRLVLAYERPFLNLASYTSGIASATHRLVKIVREACPKRPPRVTSTRKTLPGYRDIAIASVLAGGGHSHRVSLSSGVLIKENHIAAAGGIAGAIAGAREIAPHGLRVEVEVRDEDELQQALAAHADGVLLDNFKPEQIRKALTIIDQAKLSQHVLVEVSGGIHEGNICEYSIEGVDVISVGSLTHSVKATDLSLLLENT